MSALQKENPCHAPKRQREMQRRHETLQSEMREVQSLMAKRLGTRVVLPLTLRSVADGCSETLTRLGLIESPRKVGSGGCRILLPRTHLHAHVFRLYHDHHLKDSTFPEYTPLFGTSLTSCTMQAMRYPPSGQSYSNL